MELKDGNKDDLIMRKIEKLIKNFEHEITRKEEDYVLKFAMENIDLLRIPKNSQISVYKGKPSEHRM